MGYFVFRGFLPLLTGIPLKKQLRNSFQGTYLEMPKDHLFEQLKRVKLRHDDDLKIGHGHATLPYALSRKYPNLSKSWQWQYVFPAAKLVWDKDAKPRVHLLRIEGVPVEVSLAYAESYFISPHLLAEWFDDQFRKSRRDT